MKTPRPQQSRARRHPVLYQRKTGGSNYAFAQYDVALTAFTQINQRVFDDTVRTSADGGQPAAVRHASGRYRRGNEGPLPPGIRPRPPEYR